MKSPPYQLHTPPLTYLAVCQSSSSQQLPLLLQDRVREHVLTLHSKLSPPLHVSSVLNWVLVLLWGPSFSVTAFHFAFRVDSDMINAAMPPHYLIIHESLHFVLISEDIIGTPVPHTYEVRHFSIGKGRCYRLAKCQRTLSVPLASSHWGRASAWTEERRQRTGCVK